MGRGRRRLLKVFQFQISLPCIWHLPKDCQGQFSLLFGFPAAPSQALEFFALSWVAALGLVPLQGEPRFCILALPPHIQFSVIVDPFF